MKLGRKTPESREIARRRREFTACFYEGNRLMLAATLFLLTLSSVSDIAIAWILQEVIDVAGGTSAFTLGQVGILMVAFFAVSILVELVRRETQSHFLLKAMRQYKAHAFSRITGKSIASFSDENTSRYISALTNDAASVEQNYVKGAFTLWCRAIWFVLALSMMLWYDWSTTLVAIGLSLLPIGISIAFGDKLAKAERKVSDRNEGFVGMMKDILTGFSVIKSFRAEREVEKLFGKSNDELEAAKCRRFRTEMLISIISGFAGGFVQFGVFFYGVYQALHGRITIGVVMAFVQLMNYVLQPVRELPQLLGNRKAAVELIDKLADAAESHSERAGTAHPEDIGDGIALERVSFGYEPGKTVLHDVSLRFETGKSYAVVGGSGSGKTTLLNLLLGSFEGYSGRITLGGEELRDVSPESLYDLISIIQQNVFVFDSSIADNITMFKSFPAEKVESAIRRAGLASLIAARGADYPCGENGAGLSGGEKQRISIARCLLRNTPVLLMDEATAALDAATAFAVTDAILSIENLTRIIVTHRLEETLLKRYDEIVVLRNGAVEERGTFDALLGAKGYFYSLYNVAQ